MSHNPMCLHGLLQWYLYFLGHVVAYLVEALWCKPEGCGFDSRWGHWIFQLTSFQTQCGPRVYSSSNINEHQESSWGLKGGRRVRLATSPPSVSRLSRKCGSLDISTLWVSTVCYRDSVTFFFFYLYHFSIILPSTSPSLTLSLPWRFSTQNPGCVSHFPIPATCPTYLIPFDFTTLIIFGKELFRLIIAVGCDSDFMLSELVKIALWQGRIYS
jgi:hypothetical protein